MDGRTEGQTIVWKTVDLSCKYTVSEYVGFFFTFLIFCELSGE